MSDIKVSIIIPAYNVRRYIVNCVNSVMSQDTHEKLECIIVNDCSTDGGMEVAQQMIDSYDGQIEFRIIHHECNKGSSAARNTGIKAACGEFLFIIDSDDAITPDCISEFLAIAKKYPQAEVIQGTFSMTTQEGTTKITGRRFQQETNRDFINTHREIKRYVLDFGYVSCMAWNKLIRRDFLISNNLFFVEGTFHEDISWSFNLSKKLTFLAFNFEVTYLYTNNTDGQHQKKDNHCWIVVINAMINNLSRNLFDRMHEVRRINTVIDYCRQCSGDDYSEIEQKIPFTYRLVYKNKIMMKLRNIIGKIPLAHTIFDYYRTFLAKDYFCKRAKVINHGHGSYSKLIIGHNNSIVIGKNTHLKSTFFRIIGDNNHIEIGEGCTIGHNVSFWMEGSNIRITIGSHTGIANNIHFNAQEYGSYIEVGENCRFSNHIIVRTSDSHPIIDINTRERINPAKPVIIGHDVWICPDSRIMKGAVIGEHAIIGSNTLVNKEIPAYSLAVGMPAKVVKTGVMHVNDDIVFGAYKGAIRNLKIKNGR